MAKKCFADSCVYRWQDSVYEKVKNRLLKVPRSVWPDVEIKSSPMYSKRCQKVATAVFTWKGMFSKSLQSHHTFGIILKETFTQIILKNLPIWSHCSRFGWHRLLWNKGCASHTHTDRPRYVRFYTKLNSDREKVKLHSTYLYLHLLMLEIIYVANECVTNLRTNEWTNERTNERRCFCNATYIADFASLRFSNLHVKHFAFIASQFSNFESFLNLHWVGFEPLTHILVFVPDPHL